MATGTPRPLLVCAGLATSLTIAFAASAADQAEARTANTAGTASAASDATRDSAASPTAARIDAALRMLDDMDAGRFDDVHARFTGEMAAAITAEQLQQIWTTLPTQIGAAKGRGTPDTETHGRSIVVKIPLSYEKAGLIALISFASDGRIEGFFLKPQ